MSQQNTSVRGKVPFGQKAAFGAGQFVLNLLPGALAIFMFFLVTAFGMDPFLAGLLGGLPRIFDAMTDPIMGFVSDNTKTRWGRRRPYIFFGAILSGILFALLFQLSENNTVMFNFWYFLLMSLVFLIGNTMFATPLVGLGYEMTSDFKERTRLMAFANIIAQIAWMLVPWFWVVIADPTVFPISDEMLRTIGEMGLSGDELIKAKTEALQATGVRNLSVMVGLACAVLGVLPALFCKGLDAGDMENRTRISLRTLSSSFKDLYNSIVEVSKNKPFVKLCGATFLVFNGFQMVASFSFFIIVFYIFNGDYGMAGTWPAWFSMLTAMITAFAIIPIVSKLANTFGKKKAFIISTIISIIGYGLKWWGFDNELNSAFNKSATGQGLNNAVASLFEAINPFLDSVGMSWFSIDISQGGPWLMFLPIPFIAFGLGGLFTLMMSMTADVCDLDELENGLPRKEGTFGAIYWWMVKLGQAIALVLGGAVLTMVGFDEGAVTQTIETMHKLRLADIIIPSLTAGIAVFVMWRYDLSEEKTYEIQAELAKRKVKPQVSGSGHSLVNIMSGIDIKGLTREELLSQFPNYYNAPLNLDTISKESLKKYFTKHFEQGMHGICFSPFVEGQNPGDTLTEKQIRKRLEVLKSHTQWVRVFSSTNGHEMIPAIAKEMGFKVMMGAWINSNEEENNKEILSLIGLMEKGEVDIATVGNEVLFRGELNEKTILKYIAQVKSKANGIPVGYVDIYSELINHPALIAASDVVMINCYPFWEGAHIDHSGLYLQEMYRKILESSQGKKVIITETGWPSKGAVVGEAVPSTDNLLKYYLDVQLWAKHEDVELFYFSSFDESWKIHFEGWAGTSWGLWDAKENFKF